VPFRLRQISPLSQCSDLCLTLDVAFAEGETFLCAFGKFSFRAKARICALTLDVAFAEGETCSTRPDKMNKTQRTLSPFQLALFSSHQIHFVCPPACKCQNDSGSVSRIPHLCCSNHFRMRKLVMLIGFFCLINATSEAKIWQIGPNKAYKKAAQVSGLVANGDTIEIDTGLYSGDVASWTKSDLYFRSVGGGYAHFKADGSHAEGKAIWVIKGARCKVEGIEFSGCKVPDRNGAGIRQEGTDLTLIRCYFHHNEMGILTNNDGVSIVVFEACEFSYNGFGDGYSHNIYVGHIKNFTMRNCYTHHVVTGHLVKSRAENNSFYYNRITGEGGDGSYEIDLPNGGQTILVGNIIEQAATSQNGGIIAFGLEGATNQSQQIGMSHNTIWNRRSNGRFLHCSNQQQLVQMRNNLFIGSGTLLTGTVQTIDTSFNLTLPDVAQAGLMNPTNYDFRLTSQSVCRDAGTFTGQNYQPQYQYEHPLMVTPFQLTGSKPDVGAYEYVMVTSASQFEAPIELLVYPNPAQNWLNVSLKDETGDLHVRIINTVGQTIYDTPLRNEQVGISALQNGVYQLIVLNGKGVALARHAFVKM
jgi:hypothetical protein